MRDSEWSKKTKPARLIKFLRVALSLHAPSAEFVAICKRWKKKCIFVAELSQKGACFIYAIDNVKQSTVKVQIREKMDNNARQLNGYAYVEYGLKLPSTKTSVVKLYLCS